MVKLEATLSYQKNCDYLPSEITDEFDVEQQEVDITTIVTILNFDERRMTPRGYKAEKWINSEHSEYIPPGEDNRFDPYYNDELQLEAQVTFTHKEETYNIKYNDINIYFFNLYEDRTHLNPDDSEHNIARNVLLDNDGKVGIKYLPHNSGYFIIEYNETKFFKRKVVEHRIDVKSIPVKIIIKPIDGEPLPVFIHLDEAVDLMASVRDTYGNPPRDGVITFLSYANSYEDTIDLVNDRVERVIGNPVMLENGETVYYEPPYLLLNEDKDSYPISPMGDVTEGPVLYDKEWVHYIYNNDSDYNTPIAAIIELKSDIELPDNPILPGVPRFKIPTQNINDDFVISIHKNSGTNNYEYFPLTIDDDGIIKLPSEYTIQGTYHIRAENYTTEEEFDFTYTISYETLYNTATSGFISYSPIQQYALEKRENNIEYIIAWYNYKNMTYGNSWKYYDTHHGMTRISVLIPGRMNIALRKNDATLADSWQIREDGLYEFTTNDTILAYVSLVDKDGNSLLINDVEGDYSSVAERATLAAHHVKFKITGTKWNIENNEAQYTVYTYDGIPSSYKATDDDKVIFEMKLGTNEEFVSCYDYHENNENTRIDKLGPGIYTIEAFVDVEGLGKPYYDSMVSEKAYFEIIDPEAEEWWHKDEEYKPTEPDIPLDDSESPKIRIKQVTKNQSIFRGNVDIEIEVSNFTTTANVVTTLTNKGQIDSRTVNLSNRMFTLNQNQLEAGEYTVTATCPESGSHDSKTFTIDKATFYEQTNSTKVTTGLNQTIGIIVKCDGDADAAQPSLFHIGEKINYKVPLNKWSDIIPLRSCTEETMIRETGNDFGLIKLENNRLILEAFHLDTYYRQGNTGCSTWLSFFDGCAAIAHGWQHGLEWEVSFNIYSRNMAIGSSGAVFIVDRIPQYAEPGNLGSFAHKNPYHEDNNDWPTINNIEINSNGKIYLHYAGVDNRTKTEASAFHPESQYGGILGPHYFNENMHVVLRYGNKMYTCQECGYDANRKFDTCPMCSSKNITYQYGNFYTIMQESGDGIGSSGQSDYFNFTFDGFNAGSMLHLVGWNYGGTTHANGLNFYNIQFIHEQYLPDGAIKLLHDDTIYVTGKADILEEKEYEFHAVYDGDNNYNDLRPFTYDIKILGTSQNGTFTQLDSNTFRIHHKGYNSQIVIGVLQCKNATEEIRIPVISNIDGHFVINDIPNWESYVEFNLFKNPKDIDLLELMNTTNLDNVKNDLEAFYEERTWDMYGQKHYQPIQGNPADFYTLYNQYLDNQGKVLFTVYNDTTIY